MTTIREVMSTELVTVEGAATVAEAATVMGGRGVGSALVCEGGKLKGIFTERDILRALSQDFDAPSHSVADWMTRGPVVVGPEETVEKALDMMLSGGYRHLPVVEGGKILGVVSLRDLSRATAERSD